MGGFLTKRKDTYGISKLQSSLTKLAASCIRPWGAFAGGVAAKASKNGGDGGGGGGGAGDKLRRRGLVLACLDVLGPTEACLSLIR